MASRLTGRLTQCGRDRRNLIAAKTETAALVKMDIVIIGNSSGERRTKPSLWRSLDCTGSSLGRTSLCLSDRPDQRHGKKTGHHCPSPDEGSLLVGVCPVRDPLGF